MKITEFLSSRRLAIWLLILTTTVILLVNLLPNLSVMSPGEIQALRQGRPLLFSVANIFQLHKVVKSPLFLILPGFIFLSIAVCTLKRVNRWIAAEKRMEGQRGIIGSDDLKDALVFLEGRGWQVEQSEGSKIRCRKGRFGFWGSFAFHAGLEVILVGAVVSMFARYNGAIILTEDYGVTMKEAFVGPMPTGDLRIYEAIMEGFNAVYKDGFPVDYSMKLTLVGDEGRKFQGEAKVNQPVRWMGYQFGPSRFGFSPRFIMKKNQEVVLDAYASLAVMTPDKIDSIDVPDTKLRIKAQFFPDFYREGKTPKTRSREPKNPVFYVEITDSGKVIGGGFLDKGKEVSFEGYSLEFKDLKMWVQFEVSRDPGLPLIFTGFFLIISGLVARFAWNEKHVMLTREGDGLKVRGSARHFPALFSEELRELEEELEGRRQE